MSLHHEGPDATAPDGGVPSEIDAPTPYEILLGSLDELLAEWRELVRLEPWSQLPGARLLDSFPEILPRLFRLAQSGATHVDEELKARITDEHGFVRRADALPLLAVAEEWSHIKRACHTVLTGRDVGEEAIAEAMRRFEVLVDDAVGYTLRGYSRPELDALRGRGLERRDSGVADRRRGDGDRRGN